VGAGIRTLVALITVIASFAIGAETAAAAEPARFARASLQVDDFASQLRVDPIDWVGPDGQLYVVDRWYEWSATVSWPHFPARVQLLRIANPSKDQFVTVDVTGLTSYTFSGTYASGFWAFPNDVIGLTLIVCLRPNGDKCLQYDASQQLPS
jgi:hypothetical protein